MDAATRDWHQTRSGPVRCYTQWHDTSAQLGSFSHATCACSTWCLYVLALRAFRCGAPLPRLQLNAVTAAANLSCRKQPKAWRHTPAGLAPEQPPSQTCLTQTSVTNSSSHHFMATAHRLLSSSVVLHSSILAVVTPPYAIHSAAFSARYVGPSSTHIAPPLTATLPPVPC